MNTSSKNKYGSNLAWIDMLYGMVAICSFLFIVAFAMINPEAKKKTVDMKALYTIQAIWSDESGDDIDLHLLLPSHKHVWYIDKDVQYATLDRDSRGYLNNVIPKPDKTGFMLPTDFNRELISLRAMVPGHYVVNLVVYAQCNEIYGFKATKPLPYPVRIVVTKLTPSVTDVITIDVMLTHVFEQKTAVSFDIDENGNITNIDTETQVPYAEILSHPSDPGER